jgi:hypothetical protein
MTTQARSFLGLTLLIAFLGSASAYDPTSLTPGQARCEAGAAKVIGKAWTTMLKCQARCDAGAAAGKNPASDCQLPWGGATLACIEKAKGSANGAFGSRCGGGCPACYDSGGNCDAVSHLDKWIAKEINGNRPADSVEIFVSLLYDQYACTDENTLTAGELRCRDTIARMMGKQVATILGCLTRCRAKQAKGVLPLAPDPCVQPTAEPATAACYLDAANRFDTKCNAACSDPPDCGGQFCYGGGNAGNPCSTNSECPGSFCEGPRFAACFDWEGYAETEAFYYDSIPAPFATEGQSLLFCPSPSGAFLDD